MCGVSPSVVCSVVRGVTSVRMHTMHHAPCTVSVQCCDTVKDIRVVIIHGVETLAQDTNNPVSSRLDGLFCAIHFGHFHILVHLLNLKARYKMDAWYAPQSISVGWDAEM